MNLQRLVILGVVAVALLAGALWYASERRPSQQGGVQAPLVAGLTERLNTIDEVRISGAGNARLATLQRGEAGWTLAERGGYPADTAKLRELLLGLAEARRLEAKTRNPALHDRLGVEDIGRDDADGVLLEVDGGGPPLRLIVGQNVSRGSGTYVREADDPQSWQVDRNLAVEKNPASWLQRDLLDIDTARITEVEVRPVSGAPVKIERGSGSAADFVLVELPRGREPASEFVADATAGLLSSLRIDDVARADSIEPDPATLRAAHFATREGLQIAMTSWVVDGKTHARLEPTLDESRALAYVEQQQAEAQREWESRQQALDQAAAAPGAAVDDAAAAEATADAGADAHAGGTDAGADSSDAAQTAAATGTGSADDPAAASAEGDDAAKAAHEDAELAALPPLAVSDPEADRAQRLQALQDEVAALQARLDGWVFVLPNFKAANLNRDLEAYLKPKG